MAKRPARNRRSARPRSRQRAKRPGRPEPFLGDLGRLRWLWAIPAFVVAVVGSLLVWSVLPGPGTGRQLEWEVVEGESPSDAARRLVEAGLATNQTITAIYLTVLGPIVDLQPGAHWVNDGVSPRDLLQLFSRLPSRPTVQVAFPEGWNVFQVASRLEKRGVTSSGRFLDLVADPTALEDAGISSPTAEGYLFPATYEFRLNTDAAEVFKKMRQTNRDRYQRLVQRHPNGLRRLVQGLGWGEREILTLASIVEKETGVADERPVVASVFLNRLTSPSFRPRRLQSDPTTAYGCRISGGRVESCREFDGRVTPAMNRDSANAYSTYVRDGLPPGPISNPGDAAIEAVLDPAQTEYFYFVASGGGGHRFSKTFAEHKKAIREQR